MHWNWRKGECRIQEGLPTRKECEALRLDS